MSDSNRTEKTVTLYGHSGVPYVLFVITFDKEKLVPFALKYYRDNMNNLVRLRRDSDFVMVGSRPGPRHIEIRDFVDNANVTYEEGAFELLTRRLAPFARLIAIADHKPEGSLHG